MKLTTEYTKTQKRNDFKPVLDALFAQGHIVVECEDASEVTNVQVYIYRAVRKHGRDCSTSKVRCGDKPGLEITLK